MFILFFRQTNEKNPTGEKIANKWCWKNLISLEKTIYLDPYPTLNTNINLRSITDLNKNRKTTQRLEKNIGENLCELGVSKGF